MTDTSELRREIRSYTSDMGSYERKDDAIIRIKRQRGKLKRMAMTLLDEIDRLRAENARMREGHDHNQTIAARMGGRIVPREADHG